MAIAFNAKQVVTTTDPTLVIAAENGPKTVLLLNSGENGIYLGATSSVSQQNGYLLNIAGPATKLDLNDAEELWAVSPSAKDGRLYVIEY